MRFSRLFALLLCVFMLAGCAPAFVAPPEETPGLTDTAVSGKTDAIPFSDGQLYAVACLGYEDTEKLSFYAERYLDGSSIPIHYISGGEYYLIIPRYPRMAVRLYRNEFGSSQRSLLYENEESGPFVIRCNISDIFPDVTVVLTCDGETAEFSPYISLKDGGVVTGERGLDLTEPA